MRASLQSARTGRDRLVGLGTPLRPGTIIEAGLLLAEGGERKVEDSGGDARAARGYHRLLQIDAGGEERRRQAIRGFQPSALDEAGVGQGQRARNGSGAGGGPGGGGRGLG